MRERLRHLPGVIELPHVSVQVMPFVAGAYSAQNCPFRLLSFPDPEIPQWRVSSTRVVRCMWRTLRKSRSFILVFDSLKQQVLGPSESAELSQEIAEAG